MTKMKKPATFVFVLLLTLSCLPFSDVLAGYNDRQFKMNNQFREKLKSEERNAFCCEKNLRCCRHSPQPPNIKIRAILTRCPNSCDDNTYFRSMKKQITSAREQEITSFQGFDSDEPLVQNDVVKCNKKLLITMKIDNEEFVNAKSEFVVVDHVYDPLSGKKTRLLNPYVIKIRQEGAEQLYGLKFEHVVNSEAKEVVYNKHDGNYTGCDVASEYPTCGAVRYNGKIIPYSRGFCCSCDALKNAKVQPYSPDQNNKPVITYSDPSFLLDGVECPHDLNGTDYEQSSPSEPCDDKKDQDQVPSPNSDGPNFETNKYYEFTEPSSPITPQKNIKQPPDKPDENAAPCPEPLQAKNESKADNSTVPLNSPKVRHEIPKAFHRALPAIRRIISNKKPTIRHMINQINKEKTASFQHPRQRGQKYKEKIYANYPMYQKVYRLREDSRGQRNFMDFLRENDEKLRQKTNDEPRYDRYDKYVGSFNVFRDDNIEELNEAINKLRKVVSGKSRRKGRFPRNVRKGKRQVVSSGSQLRGGQNCADRYTPPQLNPESYQESTHCLRFSDVWYTVYQLQQPIIDHSINVQIFEKHENEDGQTRWRDLTRGKVVRVGTFNQHYKDDLPTLSVHYKSCKPSKAETRFAINHKNAKLLIPENMPHDTLAKYPETHGGPGEYLVVHPSQISVDGDQCNVAGVGFEAFFKQPNRCSVPKGSCLLNQPKHLWQHDKEAEKVGKKGCFFLKHYAKLPAKPIRNVTNQGMFLVMNYVGPQSTVVDMEIKADFNTVLRPQSTAKITEVYIDSTSPDKTNLVVKVTNSGLTSTSFAVSLSDCPLDMPASLNSIRSKQAVIAPQHQHIFNLQVKCVLPSDRFYCSVEVFNVKNELVALRRIRIQRFDRCICTWHCLCTCVGSAEGMKCRTMSLKHYHAAGFQGALPVTTLAVEYTFLDDMISLMFYILVFLCLVLLILGLTKALIGCFFSPQVGLWGLDILLDLPKKMNCYYEEEIRGRKVVYDQNGWPIHPDTKKRVRNISAPAEFCVNTLFFYTYPLSILFLLIKRLCCPYYTYTPTPKGIYCFEDPKEARDYCECPRSSPSVWDGVKPRKRSSASTLDTNELQKKEESAREENERTLDEEEVEEEEQIAEEEEEKGEEDRNLYTIKEMASDEPIEWWGDSSLGVPRTSSYESEFPALEEESSTSSHNRKFSLGDDKEKKKK